MIIDFKREECIDVIRNILCCFSMQTLEELVAFFPKYDYEYIKRGIEILMRKHEVKIIEQDGVQYYSIHNDKHLGERDEVKLPLDFVRAMMNSTDEKGCLKNNVDYMCRARFPSVLFFGCNDTLYEVYYIPKSKVDTLTTLINRIDYDNEDIKALPKNRVVITDSTDCFDKINIANIKYKIHFEDDGTLTTEVAND